MLAISKITKCFLKSIEMLMMRDKLLISGIFAFLTLIVLYYPTTHLTLSAFHSDDSRILERLNNLNDFHSILNFIFGVDFFKFRPIANFQYLFEYYFFASAYNAYLFYNICLILIINHVFLLFIYKKSSLFLCILLTLVLVTSKFLMYSIWNITGSFETLAAIFFLLTVYFLFNPPKSPQIIIPIFGLMLILTSERYLPFLVALPPIYFYIIEKNNFISSILSGG